MYIYLALVCLIEFTVTQAAATTMLGLLELYVCRVGDSAVCCAGMGGPFGRSFDFW
jgi:hypothetical protein